MKGLQVPPTILKKIIARKRDEILERRQARCLSDVQLAAKLAAPVRGFRGSLLRQVGLGYPAVIAEIKKASPSKGIIRDPFVPTDIALSYEQGGATCLSVLTDNDFFMGSDDYLSEAKSACGLPVLRKDFTIDPYQIWEARAIGADAILLIVACLDSHELKDLYTCALEVGLDVLIEVHQEAELEDALSLGCDLIGINNRDLHSFEVNLDQTFRLLDLIPSKVFLHSLNCFLMSSGCFKK